MKSRSLLINYSGYPTTPNAFLPDNGLAVLAGSLLSHGHHTTILDYNVLDVMNLLPQEYGERLLELKKDTKNIGEIKKVSEAISRIQEKDIAKKAREISGLISEQKIDFLAMKLWTGKAFENGMKLAMAIKARKPSIPIFAGGPHVDYFRARIYAVTDVFDALAYGEGEDTIVGLAEYVMGGKELGDIPNLVIKDGAGVRETPEKRLEDLNRSFPVYDTDVYPALKGDEKLKIFISEFSRGCPFQCNFCGHSNKSGAKWRSKSAERIVEEFRYIAETHGTRVFRNGDSNTPGPLIRDVAERIILDGLDVEYALISHVNNLEPKNLGLLKRSGCFSVFYGIESGNQHIVDHYINKGLKLDRARKVIERSSEEGLFVVTSYVYPSPGETEQSTKETLEFIKSSRTDAASICVPIITPRSTWGDYPERYGIELGEDYYDELMFFTPALFYPPTMWQPLNYRINGSSFAEIAKRSDGFAKSLEKEGVLTQVMDDAALMARHCNMSFRDFRDKVGHYLTVGNKKNMSAVVRKINETSRVRESFPVH